MIRITNSRLVGIGWSLNPPSEPMDLLLRCYRRNDTEDSTPPPGEIRFAPRDNRGPPPDASYEGSAGSDDGHSSYCHQPESSAGPQSEPPQQGRPGAVIPQKRLGKHTASIGRTLANQSQSLLVRKLLSLVLTYALVF